MKSPARILAFLFLLFASATAGAQGKISIDNVYTITLRNSGTIIEGDEIKGYYLFYQSDKIDKRTNEYTLRIIDGNLNVVKDIKFADSKELELREAAYNGHSLMFAFYDSKEKMFSYRVYGFDGKQTFNYTKVLDRRTNNLIKYYDRYQNDEEGENKNLFDVEGKGFISIIPVREGSSYTYQVNYYGTSQRKQWTFDPVEDKWYAYAEYIGTNGNTAFIEVFKTGSMLKGNTEAWIVALDVETGRKKFEIKTEAEYKFLPLNVVEDGNLSATLVVGMYYAPDAYITKAKPIGVAAWTFDDKGKIISKKYNSWEKDFSKFVKTDAKGKIKDIGYVYFHEVLKASNGKYYAIGEGFNKADEGAGMAMVILSGDTRVPGKIKTTDMLLVEFDENFIVSNVNIYDKHENYSLIPNAAALTPHMIAIMMKYTYGGFDFSYLQSDKTKSNFIVGYTSYKKTKGIEDFSFNTISYYNNQITTDKINLETKATRLSIMPAKLGSVLIMEYFKKEKRLELRLEKIN